MLSFNRNLFKNTFFILLITLYACGNAQQQREKNIEQNASQLPIITAAQQLELWLPLIENKKIGFVGNHTSIVHDKNENQIHSIDTLISRGIHIIRVFAPEHGFRGKVDAGEHVKNGIDTKTGLSIISLYGKNKKPFPEQLKDIEYMIFDIQDVGVRFYTYISTLHYIMEACAESNIPLLVLDRPNPNAHYVDGPILDKKFKSFVGMHPVPIVYGMTIGEYAKMINGEKWLKSGIQCDLKVIPIKNYNHKTPYSLPVKPSPNLPNDIAINLYPSLCFFEGTKNVSVGRGTDMQFQVYGFPKTATNIYDFCFTPQPNDGAKHPKNNNSLCCGEDLRNQHTLSGINLQWIKNTYQNSSNKTTFFNSFFEKLVGTSLLRKQIIEETSIENIKISWKQGLDNFKKTRQKYLLYK